MECVPIADAKQSNTVVFLAEHFTSLVKQAHEKDKIDEITYERLRRQPIQTLDDADAAYQAFSDSLRGRLLERIIKGAEYIEEHGEVPAAVKRYKDLCEELSRLDGR